MNTNLDQLFETFYEIYNKERGRKKQFNSKNILQEIQTDLTKGKDSIILGLQQINDFQNLNIP